MLVVCGRYIENLNWADFAFRLQLVLIEI